MSESKRAVEDMAGAEGEEGAGPVEYSDNSLCYSFPRSNWGVGEQGL